MPGLKELSHNHSLVTLSNNSQEDDNKITPLLRSVHLHPKSVKDDVNIEIELEVTGKLICGFLLCMSEDAKRLLCLTRRLVTVLLLNFRFLKIISFSYDQ